ncbi:HsmA family protein [Aneurinibacillus uraniidurans]|uniref:HsmA family protein n=1 Tax=Aneurinibacillus uraniidurans TaxID=2966586 RepID=UPI00234B08C1|nr:HsmA family protein [Aneurinibacillus sp. B1]WCN36331.1 HsmA family protein [Aneurinibacillus sp. B1]
MLTFAVVFINVALVLYTIGVWSERRAGQLKGKHLLFFWGGLLFDTLGTTFMEKLSTAHSLNLHAVTGITALVLMLIHALWATVVYFTKNKERVTRFHTFSLSVWGIWLVPYLIGVGLSFI